MSRRIAILGAVILLCLAVGPLLRRLARAPQPEKALWRTYRTFAFNTDCWIKLRYASEEESNATARECVLLLADLHNDLNRFDGESAVSQFNRAPAHIPFPCNDNLWWAFMDAQKAYRETDGAFDVTIGPLMAYWRDVAQGKREPDEAALQAARARVGFDKLSFDVVARTVTKTVEGLQVDFGGLAKGIALDYVRSLLEPFHSPDEIEGYLLNFGGNVCLALPEGDADAVAVSDPREEGRLLCNLKACNGRFVATSSDAHRALSPGKVSHVIDPHTGQPAETLLSATAVTADGTSSDCLSTALFVGGAPLARKILQRHPEYGFLLQDKAGNLIPLGNITTD